MQSNLELGVHSACSRSKKVVQRESKVEQQLQERERLVGGFDELHSKIFFAMQGSLWVQFQRSALLKAWKNKILDRMGDM